MSTDNNSKGIVLILIAMSLFSMQDALIKFIFEQSALYEIFFGRYLVAAIVLFIYLSFKGQKVSLKTHYPLLTFIRVLLHFIAFSTFFISITYMQLATANALFFSCPFFVTIFAKFFLKEFIGIRRWSAIAFGFMGVLIVLNPNFSNFEYRNLLPVLSALFYAASMTITKYTSDKDDVNTQLYYFYLIALILCGIIYLFMGNGQFNSAKILIQQLSLSLESGFQTLIILGSLYYFLVWWHPLQFLCIFSAYIIASPSVVSLFEYSLIIMSHDPRLFFI